MTFYHIVQVILQYNTRIIIAKFTLLLIYVFNLIVFLTEHFYTISLLFTISASF